MIDADHFPSRAVQREILERLLESYPGRTNVDWQDEFPHLMKELAYLRDHGLVKATFSGAFGAHEYVSGVQLTHKGVDFLQQDGGLSAILGVVTIRLHEDTIKILVEAKIQSSDLPPTDKKRWIDQLRSLPADATKHLALKLVDMGLDQGGPAAIAAIGKWLGS